jgi:drug efflux transport system permease protein
MKQFLAFVHKEFLHAFRDKRTLLIMFGLPLMQILIFGFALTNELKNAKILVADYSNDEASRDIIHKIEASTYFDIEAASTDKDKMLAEFRAGKIKAAIIFPTGFHNSIKHMGSANVQLITDGSDPNTASTITNYLSAIVAEYQQEQPVQIPIHTNLKMLYNPSLSGAMNFVPGVMALVFMLVCTTLTAVSIVREKESGTMEILLVSPFKPALVLFSKALPYFLLSLVNFCIILILGTYLLKVPIQGSILLLFAESSLFIITCLSFGLMISTRANTQQAAMLASLMGMMLPTILFTGFMFPIENMPLPLQVISNIVPAKWYYKIIQSIMLKGLGFTAVWKETLILLGMTVFLLVVSIKKFNIRLS